MKILYIAKHGQLNSNDDEGAIEFALSSLGHQVECLHEHKAAAFAHKTFADVCLFHKWYDPKALARLNMPRVFWYFDLVDYPDPTLRKRCQNRMAWMRDIVPLVDLGFCTDGDWVARDETGKLSWLPQGADSRVIGRGVPTAFGADILFTGIRGGGGAGRVSFVDGMLQRYPDRFTHVAGGMHGKDLRDLIASTNIVVAPDAPVTARYWSNRVYNAIGFGAFMMHPWCLDLTRHYTNGEEIVYYTSRQDLHNKIEYFSHEPRFRRIIADNGLERTQKEHTYGHRCKQLVETIRERLGVG